MLGQNRFLNPLNLMVAVSLAAGFALALRWAALPRCFGAAGTKSDNGLRRLSW